MRTDTVPQTMQICLGEQAMPVGTLTYSRQGTRENTSFVYDDTWLENGNRFEISPDLPLTRERYFHKAATRSDSIFHFAIADTEPDGWGCRVIARDHAKRRKSGQVGLDGKVLFFAGDQKLLVVPVPSTLSTISSVPQGPSTKARRTVATPWPLNLR